SARAISPGWLAEPPKEMSGENSFTWCTGTSSGTFISVAKRAASFTVGWTASVRPTRCRNPARWRMAGVWIAPPHTKTSRNAIETAVGRSPLARGNCAGARPAGSGHLGRDGSVAVHHETIEAVLHEHPGPGPLGAGEVRDGHALPPPV